MICFRVEMGKKGSGWFSSVKKVFKPSNKDLNEKVSFCFGFGIQFYTRKLFIDELKRTKC